MPKSFQFGQVPLNSLWRPLRLRSDVTMRPGTDNELVTIKKQFHS